MQAVRVIRLSILLSLAVRIKMYRRKMETRMSLQRIRTADPKEDPKTDSTLGLDKGGLEKAELGHRT